MFKIMKTSNPGKTLYPNQRRKKRKKKIMKKLWIQLPVASTVDDEEVLTPVHQIGRFTVRQIDMVGPRIRRCN